MIRRIVRTILANPWLQMVATLAISAAVIAAREGDWIWCATHMAGLSLILFATGLVSRRHRT